VDKQPKLHAIRWPVVRAALLRAYEQAARRYALPSDSWLVFEQIARLCWWHSRETPSHAAYAVCSEAWLAEHIACRRETISNHVWRLHNVGLLNVTNRRPTPDGWTTNLYRLCSRSVAALCAVMKRFREAAPSSPQLPISRSERLMCADAHTPGKALDSLITRWLARGRAPEKGSDG
jgi:hypothetical protein